MKMGFAARVAVEATGKDHRLRDKSQSFMLSIKPKILCGHAASKVLSGGRVQMPDYSERREYGGVKM